MNFLSIGGSDPSSGAGIQSDVKTFASLGAECFTIITAITAQNTSDFVAAEPVSSDILKDQLDAIFSDFKIDAIKIGMVYNSLIIKTLYNTLKNTKIPIVVDPVIKSTTKGALIKKDALDDFKQYIIPLATVITPNEYESHIISDIKTLDTYKIAKKIQKMGAKNIIITGIKKDNQIIDVILEKNSKHTISGKMIHKKNHGSGGIHSALVAYGLANKESVIESAKFAKKITENSIKHAKKIGKGVSIVHYNDKIREELEAQIQRFIELKDIYKLIPECQTNFVYSENPTTIQDILGISGRIIRADTRAIVAGELKYGGSKHVATALIAANKIFPDIKSAINIKYTQKIINQSKKAKFVITHYDRDAEPKSIKSNGSSIRWGIESAISGCTQSPDMVFHKGDFGKEPMIILFGTTPSDIMRKISKILKKHT